MSEENSHPNDTDIEEILMDIRDTLKLIRRDVGTIRDGMILLTILFVIPLILSIF
jgi:hypothetical protein